MAEHTPRIIEDITPHLQRWWLAERRVVGYTLTSPDVETVKEWARLVVATLEDWQPDAPYLAIHDLTTPGVSFTYSRLIDFNLSWIGVTHAGQQVAEQVCGLRPGFMSRLAIMLNLQHSAYVVNTMTKHRLPETYQHTARIFFKQDKATDWLLSHAAASVG